MSLIPNTLNDHLFCCDIISKYNFKNTYQKKESNKIKIEYSLNIFNKTSIKVLKQKFLYVAVYAFIYFIYGKSSYLKYKKTKQIKIFNFFLQKRHLLYFETINLSNFNYSKSFLFTTFMLYTSKEIFKKVFKFCKYSEKNKKIKKI